LKAGDYKVVIDSELFNGKMTFADYIIPGDIEEEIVFSTYICHPSMASNELSGPVVLIYLINWLESLPTRKYTYRFIFAPETIGAITYLSKNLEILKENVVAGFVVTCLGDDNCYSFVKSRYGNTYADRVSSCVMKEYSNTKIYSYLERGSDERQYCFPGVDLPFVALCRTKFYEYPEYHTSLDNLEYCSPEALSNSFTFLQSHILLLEKNKKYIINSKCEPQLGKRNLYPNISTKESNGTVQELMDFIVYCDGGNDIINISEITNIPWRKLITIVDQFQEHKLLKEL
jgi:aminopeptidase-like protein